MSRPAEYTSRTAWTLGAVLALAAVAAAMQLHGLRSRRFASAPTTRLLEAPEEASWLWQELGVSGRTLLLFDDYPVALLAADPRQAGASEPSNVVGYAIQHNRVRRLFLVLPDSRWEGLRRGRASYLPLEPVPASPGAVRLYTFSGVPMVAVTPASLPPLDEPVLVYVNGALFDLAAVAAVLRQKGITADVVVALPRGGG